MDGGGAETWTAVVSVAIVAGWASAFACVSVKGCSLERARRNEPTMGAKKAMVPKMASTVVWMFSRLVSPSVAATLGEMAAKAEIKVTT